MRPEEPRTVIPKDLSAVGAPWQGLWFEVPLKIQEDEDLHSRCKFRVAQRRVPRPCQTPVMVSNVN